MDDELEEDKEEAEERAEESGRLDIEAAIKDREILDKPSSVSSLSSPEIIADDNGGSKTNLIGNVSGFLADFVWVSFVFFFPLISSPNKPSPVDFLSPTGERKKRARHS